LPWSTRSRPRYASQITSRPIACEFHAQWSAAGVGDGGDGALRCQAEDAAVDHAGEDLAVLVDRHVLRAGGVDGDQIGIGIGGVLACSPERGARWAGSTRRGRSSGAAFDTLTPQAVIQRCVAPAGTDRANRLADRLLRADQHDQLLRPGHRRVEQVGAATSSRRSS